MPGSISQREIGSQFLQLWEVSPRPALSLLGSCPLLTSSQAKELRRAQSLLGFGKRSNPQPPPHQSRFLWQRQIQGQGKSRTSRMGPCTKLWLPPPCPARSPLCTSSYKEHSSCVPPIPFAGSSAAHRACEALAWAHLDPRTSYKAGAEECCVHAPWPVKRSASPEEALRAPSSRCSAADMHSSDGRLCA